MTQQQQQFDFSERGRRKLLVARVRIPRFVRPGKRPGEQSRYAQSGGVRSLLVALEDFSPDGGPVRVKLNTLGDRLHCSAETASSRIADATLLELVTAEKSKYGVYKISIQWDTVAQLILDHPATEHLIKYVQPKLTQNTNASTPVLMETFGSTSRNFPANFSKLSRTNITKERTKQRTHDEGNEFLESYDCENSPWPFTIRAEHLKSGAKVQELFLHALGCSWVSAEDRLRVFTLAEHISRLAIAKKLKSAGGAFTTFLKTASRSGIWPGSAAEEDFARGVIRKLDGTQPAAVPDFLRGLPAGVVPQHWETNFQVDFPDPV